MLKRLWEKVKAFFKDSETIFLARLQVLLGVLLAVVPTLNPVAWLDSTLTPAQRWVTATWAIVAGVLTEYARRRRSDL